VSLLLAYHRVLPDPPKENVHVLPSAQFARQVGLLAQSGLEIAPPGEYDLPGANGRPRVGITFDDGYSSDLLCAEHLCRHDIKALFFIPTATIGAPGFMDAAGVRTLAQMGMAIGSHSHDHVHVTGESADVQARLSKDILEQLVGRSVEDFSFPGGVCTSGTIASMFAAGYKRVFTVAWGVNGKAEFRSRVYRRNCLVQAMTDAHFMDLVCARRQAVQQVLYGVKLLARRCLPPESYARLQRWYCSLQR
jgi:peptidoglycan/xylan/chitin deacetylase (PgdA/CDA1 family)